jgi:hypothetical protein
MWLHIRLQSVSGKSVKQTEITVITAFMLGLLLTGPDGHMAPPAQKKAHRYRRIDLGVALHLPIELTEDFSDRPIWRIKQSPGDFNRQVL